MSLAATVTWATWSVHAAAPPRVPASGLYEIVDAGRRFDITFGTDGGILIQAVEETPCPPPGTVVAEGTWTGSLYEVNVYLYDPAVTDSAACEPMLEYVVDTIEIVDDTTLRWCAADTVVELTSSAGSPTCFLLRRSGREVVVDVSMWIPHDSILDVSLPVPTMGFSQAAIDLAPATMSPCLGADVVMSAIEGHGHDRLTGPVLAVARAQFGVAPDGSISPQTSNVSDMTVRRISIGTFDDAITTCEQTVTVPGSDVGSVTFPRPDQASLKFDTNLAISPAGPADVQPSEREVLRALGCSDTEARPCDPSAVVATVPALGGDVTVTAKPDGFLVVEASGVSFVSFGVRILVDGSETTAVVLHDASCSALDGDVAIETLYDLAREPFTLGPTPAAALTDADCGDAATTATSSAPIEADWAMQAEFLLAVRHADSGGASPRP